MRPCPTHHAGTTLVEALIAFLVLSLGLLAMSRVQGQLRLTGEVGRQRSEAVRLAQEDLEQLRSFTSLTPVATGRSYADVVSTTRTIDSGSGYASNTRYLLTRQVAVGNVPAAKNVAVSVSWADRAGETQKVTLTSVIAASDPALSGALGVAPATAPVNGAMARAPGIPPGAKNLGDGRSAYRPDDRSAVVFVFNNASGVITDRCEVESRSGIGRLTSADLTSCVHTSAYLLSGIVRHTATATTDVPDPPLPAVTVLTVDGGVYAAAPECATDTVVTAEDRYLAYTCIIYPRADGRWSGQSRIVPRGWTLGGRPENHRICPYSTAGSSALSATSDRLGRYDDVPGGRSNQNFRLIPGDLSCAP